MLKIFGEHLVDPESVKQMEMAMRLPVTVAGALMPDSHVGYGIPIGGVIALKNAVIPYAVGVDIACRVKLTIFNLDEQFLSKNLDHLSEILKKKTFFGVGCKNPLKEHHDVLDDPRWNASKFISSIKDLARDQIGTSGSGNHFVEFGTITFLKDFDKFKLGQTFLGLVSHSGSRGFGAKVCQYYSNMAKRVNPKSKEAQHLSWLNIPGEGEEYWTAMSLAGDYASANHFLIHRRIAKALGEEPLFSMENHHNFAWKEKIGEQELIVHRKGATPAGKGQLGYIPGTMADPGFLVVGKGNPFSLNSSAHGAGRVMSRRKAKAELRYERDVLEKSARCGVRVIRAGRDESPLVYKNIRDVMNAQFDCVEIIAEFHPRLVMMAGEDEEPED
ncbi:MAG: RtcB family protein [Deltaproteobacteria bacterium]|nr:RtcB family protein [Deltaproteobacteria bacterium]